MTNIENERLTDFKRVLTYHLVTSIKEKFDSNYNLYYSAPTLYIKSRNCIGDKSKIYYLINKFNATSLDGHQVQRIFGQDKNKKWISYSTLIENDPEIKVFNKGTIVENGQRRNIKARYQLQYEFIKNIFENKELLDKVLDVNSDYYSNRQRRLIFTQIKKQKHYHYKRQPVPEITDELIEQIIKDLND